LIAAGGHFGEAELFGPRTHASFAVAVEASTLLGISGDSLRRTLEDVPQLSLRLMSTLAGRALAIENDASAGHFRTGCQRVLDYLLAEAGAPLASQGETTLTLATSKQLIASRIGITPETLSRVLRDLSEAGMIVVAGRTIRLQNACINRRLSEAKPEQAVFPRRHVGRDGSGAASRRRKRVTAPTTPFGVINMAGRQRMLSQRMAKSWLLLGQGIQPGRSRAILTESANLFQEQMAALGLLRLGDDTRRAHGRVEEVWAQFRAVLARTPDPAAARELFELNERLLAATQEMTQAYTRATNSPHSYWVDLAGRQRMLSQRMAKFFLFRRWGIQMGKCRSGLAAAGRDFADALVRLSAAAHGVPEIEKQLEIVTRHWEAYQDTLDGENDDRRRLALVATSSERLLREADVAVELYEALAA
jgi:hypothetical protein